MICFGTQAIQGANTSLLLVQGISNYADHVNGEKWARYASATSAAYTYFYAGSVMSGKTVSGELYIKLLALLGMHPLAHEILSPYVAGLLSVRRRLQVDISCWSRRPMWSTRPGARLDEVSMVVDS